jgi:glycosyltransferase involved in cell wall biosynthesis
LSLRIALTADPELAVPPKLYGGIERIIDMLARELAARGCEVTLFARADSVSAGRLVAWPGRASGSKADTVRNAMTLAAEVTRGRFDLVHSFSRIAYLTPILPLPIPKLMTYQRAITRRTIKAGHALSGGSLAFSAISEWMMADVRDVGRWFMVPNGAPLDVYDFAPSVADDSPLVFLGRIEQIKGPHLAIDIAQASGRRLIIAGNVETEHRAWYEAMVAPRIDGTDIQFAGPVNDQQKNALLGQAAGFLMPILWDEPFGIVMAEALACGTPVLGLNRGAVPEVVEDGVTGFVAETAAELAERVGRLAQISRAACRARAERLYSAQAVADGYLAVYETLLGRR